MAKKKSSQAISKFSLVLVILFLTIVLFLPGQNIYQTVVEEKRPPVTNLSFIPATPAPYPRNFTGNPPPLLTAKAVLVVDILSQVALFQKNPLMRVSPASTTKIMTALVALEKYKTDEILTVKTVVSEGRIMGLTAGERLTAENLLYGTLVHSANDAAFTLAENYPGGITAFVKRMNEKAQEFSLKDTNFSNPAGFEDNNHFTSAQDLGRLAIVALNNPTLAKIVATPAITIPDATFTRFFQLENVNALLGKIPGVLGVKTGWTENAGECLITAVTKNGKKVLIILLASKDRFGETEKLINWVFENFQWETMAPPRQD